MATVDTDESGYIDKQEFDQFMDLASGEMHGTDESAKVGSALHRSLATKRPSVLRRPNFFDSSLTGSISILFCTIAMLRRVPLVYCWRLASTLLLQLSPASIGRRAPLSLPSLPHLFAPLAVVSYSSFANRSFSHFFMQRSSSFCKYKRIEMEMMQFVWY